MYIYIDICIYKPMYIYIYMYIHVSVFDTFCTFHIISQH